MPTDVIIDPIDYLFAKEARYGQCAQRVIWNNIRDTLRHEPAFKDSFKLQLAKSLYGRLNAISEQAHGISLGNMDPKVQRLTAFLALLRRARFLKFKSGRDNADSQIGKVDTHPLNVVATNSKTVESIVESHHGRAIRLLEAFAFEKLTSLQLTFLSNEGTTSNQRRESTRVLFQAIHNGAPSPKKLYMNNAVISIEDVEDLHGGPKENRRFHSLMISNSKKTMLVYNPAKSMESFSIEDIA